MENKTFCIRPFLQYSSFNDNLFRLCCSAKYPEKPIKTNELNIKEFYQSEYMTQIRKKILNGEKIAECTECYQLEERGIQSDRLTSIKDLEEYDPIFLKSIQNGEYSSGLPTELDLRVGNECNLKCQSCFPELSRGVYDDRVKLNSMNSELSLRLTDKKELNASFSVEQLKEVLPKIRKLKIIGGEPLMSKSVADLIDYINLNNYAENIELRFHTNLTIYDTSFLNKLYQFKRVYLTFSMDGVGELNNYLRYPSKWENCSENLKKYIKNRNHSYNFRLRLSPVIQLTNISSMYKLLKYFAEDLRLQDYSILTSTINLMEPSYLSAFIAPDELKNKSIESFMNLYESYDDETQENFQDLKDNFLAIQNGEVNYDLLAEYIKVTESYDLMRGNSVRDVFPEYDELKKNVQAYLNKIS